MLRFQNNGKEIIKNKVMTQEEKELLLKDICARLSYGVMCQVDDGAAGLNDGKLVEIDISKELVRFDAGYYWDAYIDDIKPYLRPMSSMTEDEEIELSELFWNSKADYQGATAISDFCYAHHLDNHDLIPAGLAIEVNKNNNPYK